MVSNKTLVKRLVKEYGGATRFAALLGVKYRTVTQWMFSGHIPQHHLLKITPLSSLYNPLFESESVKTTRPRTTLPTLLKVKRQDMTLEQAAEHLGMSHINLKKMYECHHANIELMATLFPKVERREMTLAEAGRQLGLDRRTVHQMYTKFGYVTQPRPMPLPKHDEALEMARDVVRGVKKLTECPAWRTVHRRVCKLIGPLTLNDISPWPPGFRAALLSEAEGDHVGVVFNLMQKMNYYNLSISGTGRVRVPNWKEASGYEMLVPVLSGEMTVDEVADMRGGAVPVIRRIFDMALETFGYTFDQVLQFDIGHQMAIIEVLNAFNAVKHRLNKDYEVRKVELNALQAFTILRVANKRE